jgi:hypothetical protein
MSPDETASSGLLHVANWASYHFARESAIRVFRTNQPNFVSSITILRPFVTQPRLCGAYRVYRIIERILHLAAQQVGQCRPGAALRHVNVDSGHHLEHLSEHMISASNTGRCKIDLARIGFGVSDKLVNILSRKRWVHEHDPRLERDTRNRHKRNSAASDLVSKWPTSADLRVAQRGSGHGRTAASSRTMVHRNRAHRGDRRPLHGPGRSPCCRPIGCLAPALYRVGARPAALSGAWVH